ILAHLPLAAQATRTSNHKDAFFINHKETQRERHAEARWKREKARGAHKDAFFINHKEHKETQREKARRGTRRRAEARWKREKAR
ncbi:MAG: hypothetical protein MSB12_02350, partial [Lentisphaeraceae bacterium]|nr:hypothetical protein [Lentisphaeraceae bacterium]